MVPNLTETDEDALRGIVNYCDRAKQHIEKFGHSYDAFEHNLAFQEACSFDAIQIGESARHLSDEYKTSHPEIPWHQVIALRNNVAHAYGHIDIEVLWETITEDFPALRAFCAKQIGLE